VSTPAAPAPLAVFWPGRKRTTFRLQPWQAEGIAINLAMLLGLLVLWSAALFVWAMFGYWLVLKYTVLACGAMLGVVGAVTLFGIRFSRLF
jgi:hypothetical protein